MPARISRRVRTSVFALAGTALLFWTVGAGVPAAAQARKDFSVSAHKYSYNVEGSSKPEIRVQEGDLVHITFSADDIPHSFSIEDDHYRIMRRAEPGKPVTFDFLADKPGTFTFRCTLRTDDRCRELVGSLFVAPKK